MSFDLDSTLLDNGFIRGNIGACCEFAAERIGIDTSIIASSNAAEFAAYWPLAEARLARGELTGGQMIQEVWRRVLDSCGCDDPQVLSDLINEHLRLDDENARLFDDVRPVIGDLRARDVPLALITNGASDVQRARLAALAIEEWFDVVVISAEIGHVKPNAEVFAMAAKGVGVDGRDLWHVGDNLETDVGGASSAGHTAVWLNRDDSTAPSHGPEPHFEITSLFDLPPLLEANL